MCSKRKRPKKRIELTERDYAAADEVGNKFSIDAKQHPEARKFLAEQHAHYGRSKFRLIHGLRKPICRYEALQYLLHNNLINHEEYDKRVLEHAQRPIDQLMLDDLFFNLERKLKRYSQGLQAAALLTKSSVSPRDRRNLENDVTKNLRVASGKTKMHRIELETLRPFLRRVRLELKLGTARDGKYNSMTAMELVFIVTDRAHNCWASCVENAKKSRNAASLYEVESVELFYKHGGRELPNPQSIMTLVDEEIGAAELKLEQITEAKNAPANPSTSFQIDTATFSIEKADINGNFEQTKPKADVKAKKPPVLTVSKWSDLAIGINEKKEFFAITPVPSYGSVIQKSTAIKVEFKGDQLPAVLESFANSPTPNSVPNYDMLKVLGLLPSGNTVKRDGRARSDALRAQTISELENLESGWREQLNKTLSNVAYTFREVISGPTGGEDSCLALKELEVVSRFTVRYMFPDANRTHRFGENLEIS